MSAHLLPPIDRTNPFRLEGRVALLTGAGGHLGKAMAEGLARAGAHVVINGRSPELIQRMREALQGQGLSVSGACFDITDHEAAERQIQRIGEEFGHLDILVNNAYDGCPGTIASASPQDFANAYEVAVAAAFFLIRRCLPWFRIAAQQHASGASIINIASMYGVVSPKPSIYGKSGFNSPPYYGAAKAGLIQMTRYIACHLAADRVRVNCISPGPFPTPEVAQLHPEFYQKLCDQSPMGRIGLPEELIGPLLFLASDASSYVTGINLEVDGGWTSW